MSGDSKYRQNNRVKCAGYDKKYRETHKAKRTNDHKKYQKTLIGYCHCLFISIKQRCNNPKATGYKYWGGRGIKCLFRNADEFVAYVINELQIDPRGLDIDRIDNEGHYERGNIRFTTRAENLKNRRQFSKNL